MTDSGGVKKEGPIRVQRRGFFGTSTKDAYLTLAGTQLIFSEPKDEVANTRRSMECPGEARSLNEGMTDNTSMCVPCENLACLFHSFSH